MTRRTQADLAQQLRAANTPSQQRDLALELLAATRSREYVDLALRHLARDAVQLELGDAQRSVLREKIAYYFDNDRRDRGGSIRAQIIDLLAIIGHPGDLDIYQQGVRVYQRYPPPDIAQNCRAAALRAIAGEEPTLAGAYAVHLLGEPDTSTQNGEPSLMALRVLAQIGQLLPVYQFVRWQGDEFVRRHNPELVGQALEALAGEFPLELYRDLAAEYIERDIPATTSAIINGIVEERLAALYPLIEQALTTTRHDDAHRYAVILLSASRDAELTDLLYSLAQLTRPPRIMHFIEAIDLTHDPRRAETLAMLERRL